VIGIVAPGIAAVLFKVLSVPSVLALDALSFVASAPWIALPPPVR
jgi:hypothetical protein